MPPGYQVQLVPEEYAANGVFARLASWLAGNMGRFGFHRPYSTGGCGAGIEPWHLSYAPLAQQAMAAFSVDMLEDALAAEGIDALDAVRRRLPEIVARYVLNVEPPPLSVDAIPGTRRA